jgi:hypothetical protein
LGLCENRALRRINRWTYGWEMNMILAAVEKRRQNLNSSRMRCAGHAPFREDKMNAYKVFGRKTSKKETTPKACVYRWEGNINMNLREIGSEFLGLRSWGSG